MGIPVWETNRREVRAVYADCAEFTLCLTQESNWQHLWDQVNNQPAGAARTNAVINILSNCGVPHQDQNKAMEYIMTSMGIPKNQHAAMNPIPPFPPGSLRW